VLKVLLAYGVVVLVLSLRSGWAHSTTAGDRRIVFQLILAWHVLPGQYAKESGCAADNGALLCGLESYGHGC